MVSFEHGNLSYYNGLYTMGSTNMAFHVPNQCLSNNTCPSRPSFQHFNDLIKLIKSCLALRKSEHYDLDTWSGLKSVTEASSTNKTI